MPTLRKHNPGEPLTDHERALVDCLGAIITALRGADIGLGNEERTQPLPLEWRGLIRVLAAQTGIEHPRADYAMLQVDARQDLIHWLTACARFIIEDVKGEQIQREVVRVS